MKPFQKLALALILALATLPLAAADKTDKTDKTAKTDKTETCDPATHAKAGATKGAETAVFTVPGLKDDAVVKSLAASLAKEPGVVSAKPDAAAGKFLVTYDSGKTSTASLEKAMAKVAPASKLEKVGAADPKDAAKHDCGKCPSKSTCSKAG